jgi:hypothetical protein
MSECIIIVLQGGMGNQLFQYAAGLAAASRLGGELWLTPTQENKHSGTDHRQTLYIRGKAIGPDGTPPMQALYSQQSGAFDVWSPSDFQGYPAIAMKGYYQYLPAIESQISLIRSDLFQRLADIRSTLRQKYHLHNPRQTCFLHVRRGDYTKTKPGTFWVQDESYFLPALQAIKQRTSGPRRWMVLSDDIAWCKQQPWMNTAPFEMADEPEELYGLMLMSMCEGGAIICNSSFSWWGAMLGCGSQGAPVVYPSKWFAELRPELFPTNWIRV